MVLFMRYIYYLNRDCQGRPSLFLTREGGSTTSGQEVYGQDMKNLHPATYDPSTGTFRCTPPGEEPFELTREAVEDLKAVQTEESLPEDLSEEIERGLADVAAGRVIPHAEVRERASCRSYLETR